MAYALFRSLAGALILVTGAAAARAQYATPAAATAPAFTQAQRDEIVAVVRSALRADPSILRDAVTALQADEAGRQDVAARAAIAGAGSALARAPGDPVAGDPNGDITVVEFYDIRCPYCRRMVPTVSSLLASDPRVRLVYKDIPILGPPSVLGAKALLAAQRQGGYQTLHDVLMAGPPQIDEDALHAAATRVGLDWPRLRRDMEDAGIRKRIDTNIALAHALGVDGTPAYVIGTRLLAGAVPLEALQAAIASARAGNG